jgi:hypothetical protein
MNEISNECKLNDILVGRLCNLESDNSLISNIFSTDRMNLDTVFGSVCAHGGSYASLASTITVPVPIQVVTLNYL